ncbi:hypothetical protein [Coleofasciculus chthonoplastes]|uniref:hypothetical protein n=1 Tax=Coleofasciculus chthonoplastes TaxID=64178 RepID=UPI0012FA41A1|nr:hypothetical protein [Coleofasciculus chthonoplastes]
MYGVSGRTLLQYNPSNSVRYAIIKARWVLVTVLLLFVVRSHPLPYLSRSGVTAVDAFAMKTRSHLLMSVFCQLK